MKRGLKDTVLLLFCCVLGGVNSQAQEKRKVDLVVDMLSPVRDATYNLGEDIPFKVMMTNKGPDALLEGDTVIYIFNEANTYMMLFKEDFPVGEEIALFDSYLASNGSTQTGQFDVCVEVIWNNEILTLTEGGAPLTSSWIDEKDGNNKTCVVFNVKEAPSHIEERQAVAADLNVYPNPSQGHISFAVDDAYVGDCVMKVYSVAGSKIIDRPLNKSSKRQIFNADLDRLPAGVYYLQLNNPIQNYSTQFVIQK